MHPLESRLRTAGISCRVEARDRLAILVPDAPAVLEREHRIRALQLAREDGFTHVTVELDPVSAIIPRD